MIQKDHIVGSSSGLKVCDKPGFEPKNKRPKIVDNVCLTSIKHSSNKCRCRYV